MLQNFTLSSYFLELNMLNFGDRLLIKNLWECIRRLIKNEKKETLNHFFASVSNNQFERAYSRKHSARFVSTLELQITLAQLLFCDMQYDYNQRLNF